MAKDSALIFSEHWNIYQKILLHNYMHHEELGIRTTAACKELAPNQLNILDVGCGDAVALMPVFEQVPVASYTGYDLSLAALQVAESHLTRLPFPHMLKEGNMAELIREENQHFNIIHSSFAIHHLQEDEKRNLLNACLDRLVDGGKMIYIDIFRQRGSTRDQFIEDYLSFINNEWPLLTANEKQLIYDHIRQYDFPSDLEATIERLLASKIIITETYQPDNRHAMLLLCKE